jgi:hypothetical protein
VVAQAAQAEGDLAAQAQPDAQQAAAAAAAAKKVKQEGEQQQQRSAAGPPGLGGGSSSKAQPPGLADVVAAAGAGKGAGLPPKPLQPLAAKQGGPSAADLAAAVTAEVKAEVKAEPKPEVKPEVKQEVKQEAATAAAAGAGGHLPPSRTNSELTLGVNSDLDGGGGHVRRRGRWVVVVVLLVHRAVCLPACSCMHTTPAALLPRSCCPPTHTCRQVLAAAPKAGADSDGPAAQREAQLGCVSREMGSWLAADQSIDTLTGSVKHEGEGVGAQQQQQQQQAAEAMQQG